jgi:integrase
MYAGLRRGELIPLQWADIYLTSKTININKSTEIINGKSMVKPYTKTAAGMRVVYLDSIHKVKQINKLDEYYQQQQQEQNRV